MNTEIIWSQLLISIAKVAIAICYLVIGLVLVPRIDAPTTRSDVYALRIALTAFLGLSIGTYLHVSWFIFSGRMPGSYWMHPIYMAFVFCHALAGVWIVYRLYGLVGLRVVDDKIYAEFIERQIAIEAQKLSAEVSQEELNRLLQHSKEINDMAKLILKVYRG